MLLPWWRCGKESTCQCKRHRFDPWVRKIPWRRKELPTPEFLPRKSHGQRNLVGYSPWGCKRVGHDLVTKEQQESLALFVGLQVWCCKSQSSLLSSMIPRHQKYQEDRASPVGSLKNSEC